MFQKEEVVLGTREAVGFLQWFGGRTELSGKTGGRLPSGFAETSILNIPEGYRRVIDDFSFKSIR